MTPSRALRFAFPLLALPLLFPAVAAAASDAATTHLKLSKSDKSLWQQVMTTFYGPYDKAQKCWVSKTADNSYCMRPHTLHRMNDGADHLLFLSVAGHTLDGDNDCHACTGNMGLLVLKAGNDSLDVIARSEPYMEVGSNGEAPFEEGFSVHRLGPPSTFAWAVDSSWMGQGISVTVTDLYGVIGNEVKPIGQLPQAFDDEGNCENGVNITTNEKCSDVSIVLSYEAGGQGPFMDISLKGSGTLKGEPFTQTYVAHFDKASMSYARPGDLPEEISP